MHPGYVSLLFQAHAHRHTQATQINQEMNVDLAHGRLWKFHVQIEP